MIIVGDIACPNEQLSKKLEKGIKRTIFKNNTVIFNLEGLIADTFSTDTDTPILFNHSSLLQTLGTNCAKVIAVLANNHTLDLPQNFHNTITKLKKNKIHSVGAGKTREKSLSPATFREKGKDVFLFNYCWDFLLYHQKNPAKGVYIAEIDEQKIIQQISQCRESNPNAAIVIYFHWSIDLEILPYPLYRQFSKKLIDSGANVIAGCHSHCVQGGEKYKEGYIFYGLGNFYLPWNVYANGKLDFPEFSKLSLSLEWNPENNKAVCHWFTYDETDHTIEHLKSEDFENSKLLADYSPYRNMNNSEYVKYFKRNRRKKFLIPVFTDYRKIWYNKWLNLLIKTRAKTARILAKYNLIKWQN